MHARGRSQRQVSTSVIAMTNSATSHLLPVFARVDLGFERGEVLAILGDNRPEWLISELAAQSLGGISVGLYPDGIVEEVEHVLSHAGVRVVVAEDQEQVDKLLALRGAGQLDTVEWIVYYDPHGLEHYDDAALVDFVELERRGDELGRERAGWLDEQVARGNVSDAAILCTTSGTTAKPKLAVLTHRNLLSMGAGLMEVDPIDSRDEYVSFLPLAWIGEQMVSVACSLPAVCLVTIFQQIAIICSRGSVIPASFGLPCQPGSIL
jgi:long-chain acyl-CoA synthetase